MAQQFAHPQHPPSQLDQVVEALQLALHTSNDTNAGLETMRQTSNQTVQHFEAARLESHQRSAELAHELRDQRQHMLHQEAQLSNIHTRLEDQRQQPPPQPQTVRDPGFPQWNGKQSTVEQWLKTLDQMVALKDLPDFYAVGYAKLAMPHYCRDVMQQIPVDITWLQFHTLCLEKFQPRYLQFQLHAEFDAIRMEGNDLAGYIHHFQTLSSKLENKPPEYLLRTFIRGLSARIQRECLENNPTTLDAAIKLS